MIGSVLISAIIRRLPFMRRQRAAQVVGVPGKEAKTASLRRVLADQAHQILRADRSSRYADRQMLRAARALL
jgi:hypothetical protein